jgi:hypothetical protein
MISVCYLVDTINFHGSGRPTGMIICMKVPFVIPAIKLGHVASLLSPSHPPPRRTTGLDLIAVPGNFHRCYDPQVHGRSPARLAAIFPLGLNPLQFQEKLIWRAILVRILADVMASQVTCPSSPHSRLHLQLQGLAGVQIILDCRQCDDR